MAIKRSGIDAADNFDRALASWQAEIDTLQEDMRDKCRIESLVYDLYLTNDLFRGLIDKHVDTIVGSKVILQCNPDYESLGATPADAKEWCKIVEREWKKYADCEEGWITADRSGTFTELMRSATKHLYFTGEIFGGREWRASPLGFKTCFSLVSSNRIETPKSSDVISDPANETRDIFHGIEFDRFGASTHFHVSQYDYKPGKGYRYESDTTPKSKRIAKYNRFGIQQIFHVYEPFKPEYPRGISKATAIIKKIKQLERFHDADLEKAIIAATFALVVTSPEGPEDVAAMLSGKNKFETNGGGFAFDAGDSVGIEVPQEIQENHDALLKQMRERYIELSGGQWVHAFNDEKIEMLQPHSNMGSTDQFGKTHARSIANGLGMSYELGTGNFDGLSFSGGQLSLGIYEHSANITRTLYIHKFAKLCFRSWLDEFMSRDTAPLLNDMSFRANRECYARCNFSGAKRVHVDPVKNARANSLSLQNGTTSRIDIVNAEGGDMEQIMRNRANEAAMVLEAVRQVAKESGIVMTPEAEMRIVVDMIATKQVETPEQLTEGDENE